VLADNRWRLDKQDSADAKQAGGNNNNKSSGWQSKNCSEGSEERGLRELPVSLVGNLFVVAVIEPLILLLLSCCHIFCHLWCGVGGFSFHFFYHFTFSTEVSWKPAHLKNPIGFNHPALWYRFSQLDAQVSIICNWQTHRHGMSTMHCALK
jgi:hypothetical protein